MCDFYTHFLVLNTKFIISAHDAVHELDLGGVAGREHRGELLRVERHGLLAEDVLARLRGLHHPLDVQRGGQRNVDRVDVVTGKQRVVALNGFGSAGSQGVVGDPLGCLVLGARRLRDYQTRSRGSSEDGQRVTEQGHNAHNGDDDGILGHEHAAGVLAGDRCAAHDTPAAHRAGRRDSFLGGHLLC